MTPRRVLALCSTERTRRAVIRVLGELGHAVEAGRPDTDAIERLDRAPDLVVVEASDEDGLRLCERLRERGGLLVLAITTLRPARVAAAGADAILRLPFEAEELATTTSTLLRLASAERDLAQIDERREQFLAHVGHELRTPLATLTAALPVLDLAPRGSALEGRTRSAIDRQLGRLCRLIDDLLDAARATQGRMTLDPRPIDLAGVLAQVVEARRSEAPVALRVPGEPVVVHGDRGRIEQAIGILLERGLRAGGPVVVSLEVDRDRARVAVADRGERIDPATAFEPFGAEGTDGVALALARRLVELHGGRIAASRSREGNVLSFELPRRDPGVGDAAVGGRHVLIVEDNADARQTLADLCELWGHQVTVAEDGLTGLERALHNRPEVALVDIGLPGLDGYELARRIRADPRGSDLHLVAMTGLSSPRDVERAQKAGLDVHLVKPVEPSRLRDLLANLQPRRTTRRAG